jgi:hypothetical protein
VTDSDILIEKARRRIELERASTPEDRWTVALVVNQSEASEVRALLDAGLPVRVEVRPIFVINFPFE